jgi:hypothetical protein
MADALILDRRAALAGKGAMHVILIGVSDYIHLPPADDLPGEGLAALKKLSSSSITVAAVARKLLHLDAEKRLARPLGTIRLLHSPVPEELAAEPDLATIGGVAAVRSEIAKALRAWRDDVATAKDAQAFFYFCGHGIRRTLEESILLAADFLEDEPKLFNSFRLSNIRNGMVPSPKFPDIGREQFYFVDACREKPDALDTLDTTETPKIFDAELGSYDDRKAPIFFATTSGGLAAGPALKPTYFGSALLWAMDNGSFDRRPVEGVDGNVWPVTPPSLKVGIETANAMFDSRVELTGLVADPVLCFRRDPPKLPIAIRLRPDPLHAPLSAMVINEMNTGLSQEITPCESAGPYSIEVAAGMYQIAINPASPQYARNRSDIVYISIQSKMPWTFDLGAAA